MILSTLLASLAFAAPASGADISQTQIERYMRVLTSERFGGRLTLDRSEVVARDYLVQQFRLLGLQPGNGGSFLHEFEISVNQRMAGENRLAFDRDGRTVTLSPGQDWTPLVGSNATAPLTAPLVWVGYGLKREGWDDFAGVDLTGKIAVMFRAVPAGETPVLTRVKAQSAKEAGAVGVIVVGPDTGGVLPVAPPTRRAGLSQNLEMAGASVSDAAFARVSGIDLKAEAARTAPASRSFGMSVTLQTNMEPNRGTAYNVIGVLPGRDPELSAQTIVIGAHYDHLGFGLWGSRTGTERMHPGADDNASGVAGVLELAEYFARTRSNRRTIVFQLYSGEEIGLVGAAAWVRDQGDKVRQISAMVNMDMIGRLRDENLIVYSTSTSTEWAPLLGSVTPPSGVKLQLVPAVTPGSDHGAFARAQVPALFFHTGLHQEYHTELDTYQTVNYPGMVKVIEVVRDTVRAIDARSVPMPWNTEAEMGGRPGSNQPSAPGGGTARRVRVGFIPDMASTTGPGVLLSGVIENSPAARSGLKAGDRVVELGGRSVGSVEDLQTAINALTAGTKTTVVIVRDGSRVTIELTPEERPGG